MELIGAGVTLVVATALIALVWLVTVRTINEQRTEIRELAQRTLSGQAAVIARDISFELLMVDQSLTILQDAWKTDSKSFDLARWKANMPALAAVTDDLFIADETHRVQQDILPQAVGQGVASAYITWPHGSLERLGDEPGNIEDSIGLSQSGKSPVEARRFLMYVVRPLDHPAGWLIGASFKTDELPKLFTDGTLGLNAVAAIVDTQHAGLQTIVGTAARRPRRSIAQTDMYEAISKSESGIWEGDSAIDGVRRIHAFHRIPGRDMIIVVAATEAEAMAPADTLVNGALALAIAATIVVFVIACLIGWALYRSRANQREARARERDEAELVRLRADETTWVARSQLQESRMRALVDHGSDGIALVDSDLRVAQWNRRFERGIGVPLQENMPLDALIRAQFAHGVFGPVSDPEAEIARRVAILRTGDGPVPQPGPGNEELVLRGLPIDEGGSILLLSGLANMPAPSVGPASEIAPHGDPQTAAPASVQPEPLLPAQAGQAGTAAPIEW
jgi:PAS domain-containing protein